MRPGWIILALAFYFLVALVWWSWANVYGWVPGDVTKDSQLFFFITHLAGLIASVVATIILMEYDKK